MVASGSEPTYLPLTNTSCAGFLLYCLVAANALEAVARAMAIASAVLNMVVSPAVWIGHTSPGVRMHLERTGGRGESAGGPTPSPSQQRLGGPLSGQTPLIINSFFDLRVS